MHIVTRPTIILLYPIRALFLNNPTMAATFRTRPLRLASIRPSFISPVSGSLVNRASLEQSRGYARKLDASFKQAKANIRAQFRGQQATSTVMKEMAGTDQLQDPTKAAMLAPSV